MTELLFVTFLAMFPHFRYGTCIETRRAQIVAHAADASREAGVPPGVLLVVGFLESSWGCHPASGGSWGAPIDPRHRLVAGTAYHATRALARSYAVCGSWRGAIGRFRSGICRPWQANHRAYVARAIALIERLHTRSDTPLPEHLR